MSTPSCFSKHIAFFIVLIGTYNYANLYHKKMHLLHLMQSNIIFILHLYTYFNVIYFLMLFNAAPFWFPTWLYMHLQPIVSNCTLQWGLFKRHLYTLLSIKECTHRSAFWTHTKIGFVMAHLWRSCMFSECNTKFTFLRQTLIPIYIESSIRWHSVSICLYLRPSFIHFHILISHSFYFWK